MAILKVVLVDKTEHIYNHNTWFSFEYDPEHSKCKVRYGKEGDYFIDFLNVTSVNVLSENMEQRY